MVAHSLKVKLLDPSFIYFQIGGNDVSATPPEVLACSIINAVEFLVTDADASCGIVGQLLYHGESRFLPSQQAVLTYKARVHIVCSIGLFNFYRSLWGAALLACEGPLVMRLPFLLDSTHLVVKITQPTWSLNYSTHLVVKLLDPLGRSTTPTHLVAYAMCVVLWPSAILRLLTSGAVF